MESIMGSLIFTVGGILETEEKALFISWSGNLWNLEVIFQANFIPSIQPPTSRHKNFAWSWKSGNYNYAMYCKLFDWFICGEHFGNIVIWPIRDVFIKSGLMLGNLLCAICVSFVQRWLRKCVTYFVFLSQSPWNKNEKYGGWHDDKLPR